MSAVVLQVGQCGNQLGERFFKAVARDALAVKCNLFQSPDGKLRSINVDSECKIIKKLRKNQKIRDQNVIMERQGCGTNWAMGYYGIHLTGEKHLLMKTMESIRQEAERCDCFCGTIIFHSISGGTGSGFGSCLVENLRDEISLQYILSCAIVPFTSGESPLQHYNNALSLAWLQRYTDGVIFLQNDYAMQSALQRCKHLEGQRISFDDINKEMAASLAGLFLPTDSLNSKSGWSTGQEPWELVRSVCPVPDLKLVLLRHQSKSRGSWDNTLGWLMQAFKRYDQKGRPHRSVSSLVVTRGDLGESFHRTVRKQEARIRTALGSVSWNSLPIDYWTAKSNCIGLKDAPTMTVASNHSSVTDFLEMVLKKSKNMYENKAFLHWYWRYGVTKDDFENAFEVLQASADIYKEYTG